jgi:hypothetical protein
MGFMVFDSQYLEVIQKWLVPSAGITWQDGNRLLSNITIVAETIRLLVENPIIMSSYREILIISNRVIRQTARPFQPFFLAATDLLNLARPYYEQIEAGRKRYYETGVIEILQQNVWRLDKSLSIGSFLVKYAGLEALANCAYEDHKKREVADLPSDYSLGPLQNKRGNLQKKAFCNWHLATRLFLLIPLCSDPEIDPRNVFDIASDGWKEFEEIIEIRHSFSHAVSVRTELVVAKVRPGFHLANNQDPVNFWPLTNTPRDHRILNFEAASRLCSVIDWVIEKLRSALPIQLNESYMTEEQGKVSDS